MIRLRVKVRPSSKKDTGAHLAAVNPVPILIQIANGAREGALRGQRSPTTDERTRKT